MKSGFKKVKLKNSGDGREKEGERGLPFSPPSPNVTLSYHSHSESKMMSCNMLLLNGVTTDSRWSYSHDESAA